MIVYFENNQIPMNIENAEGAELFIDSKIPYAAPSEFPCVQKCDEPAAWRMLKYLLNPSSLIFWRLPPVFLM